MKNIFIGGSTSSEIDDKYKKEAIKLGNILSKINCNFYCCASTIGIIGSIYNMLDKKRVKSAVPKAHLNYEDVDKDKISVITDTINQRTDYIFKNCDICIFMPGGIGTIYEIMSAIETKRANEHNCKIIIVNLFGYFDELLNMLDKTYTQKFATISNKNMYIIVDKIEQIDRYF